MAQPLLEQPGAANSGKGDWMHKSEAVPGVPKGLENLALADYIFVKQKREALEIAIGWETRNKYVVLNGRGEKMFYAFEESDECARMCCGSDRGFVIHITDSTGKEVMRVTREFNECAGCCAGACAEPGGAFSHQVKVESPPGNTIGIVSQRAATTLYSYEVADRRGKAELIIDSPGLFDMTFSSSKAFCVRTNSGTQVGEIRKKWGGFLKEMFTDADNFGVKFPADLAIHTKATLIGATFLIDFVHFESSN